MSDVTRMTGERCGHTIIDADGEEQPCDRPATSWRWYQDQRDHEDLLDVACSLHENEGGRRIRYAESELAALRGERDRVRIVADHWHSFACDHLDEQSWKVTAHALSMVKSALAGEADPVLLGIPVDHPDAEAIRATISTRIYGSSDE